MPYIPIEKFINYIEENNPPRTYWCSRFHKNFLRTISLDEYVKWLHYLIDKRRAYSKEYKKTKRYKEIQHKYYLRNREIIIERQKRYYHEKKGDVREYISRDGKSREYKSNKEYYDRTHKEYVKKNRKKINKYMREYMKKWSAKRTEEQKNKRKEYYREWYRKKKLDKAKKI